MLTTVHLPSATDAPKVIMCSQSKVRFPAQYAEVLYYNFNIIEWGVILGCRVFNTEIQLCLCFFKFWLYNYL